MFLTSCSGLAHAGEEITIHAIDKTTPKMLSHPKKAEDVTLVGDLRTIPMSGAKTTIQSTNYGQVILFSPMLLDMKDIKQLDALEAAHTYVKVTGRMLTLCSEKELRADVLGCRWMDSTKTITIQKN